MDLNLASLRVMVTGGASGIGAEIARAFRREGARVHVGDMNARSLEDFLATEPEMTGSQVDIVDRDQVVQFFMDARSSLGGLDVLINNAGMSGPHGPIDEIAAEDWDRCLAVNITGQFNCARLAVPLLRNSKNASIVNLSSVAGRLGIPLRTPYAASKWAVVGFTKSLAMELGRFRIRVNAIQPGMVKSARVPKSFAKRAEETGLSIDEVEREALATVSLGTMVSPDQIADAILFLCSPRGRTISGQAISICGDTWTLGWAYART